MKINVLKENAEVDVKITPGHLHRLQQLMMIAISDKSQEELDKMNSILNEAASNNDKEKLKELDEWMHPVIFIISFIKEIETKAVDQGLTYEKEIDDISTTLN